MSLPVDVTDRDVLFGGGVAALAFAATRAAIGKPPPIVLEKNDQCGGIFAQLTNFLMNSAGGASVASVATPGPTRIRPVSPTDTLNWLPNSRFQFENASGMTEYPYSQDAARAIQQGLAAYAEVYTNAEATFDSRGHCYDLLNGACFGRARRVLWAAGLTEPPGLPKGAGIMSGYAFLKKPVRELAGKKIAVVGGGDTAAQVVEYMVSQGIMKPTTRAEEIHWYGTEKMPVSKGAWMASYHARFAGIGRHLPQDGVSGGILRPFAVRGRTVPLGGAAMVNGQVYDLAVLATGFVPAPSPVSASSIFSVVEGMNVARFLDDGSDNPRVFKIGTAADLYATYLPYQSRFLAAASAIYRLAPLAAALAASLP